MLNNLIFFFVCLRLTENPDSVIISSCDLFILQVLIFMSFSNISWHSTMVLIFISNFDSLISSCSIKQLINRCFSGWSWWSKCNEYFEEAWRNFKNLQRLWNLTQSKVCYLVIHLMKKIYTISWWLYLPSGNLTHSVISQIIIFQFWWVFLLVFSSYLHIFYMCGVSIENSLTR